MKKVFILTIAYYTIAVVLQGCCGKADCIPYFNLSGGVLRVSVNGQYQQTGTHVLVGVDTLRTELDFIHEYIAQSGPGFQLMPGAYAFQCESCDNGDRGLKDKVRGLTLTSNQPYNGIAAGGSLNNFFKLEEQELYAINTIYVRFDSLGYVMNQGGTRNGNPYKIVSGVKPGNPLLHKLNLKLEFESGKVLNAVSPDFSWN